MFKKMKDNMIKKAQQHVGDDNPTALLIKKLFEEQVSDASNYVYGVAQIEEEEKGGAALATRMLANRVMLNWTDYIVGYNATSNTLVLIELNEDTVVSKQELTNFTIKKDTLLGNELKNTLKGALGTRGTRRSGDRLGRDTFSIKSDAFKKDLLVGSYLNEATNHPFNNIALIDALKAIK